MLIGACVCEDKWIWKRDSQEKSAKYSVREETTPRNGQNDDISNDYPDYSQFGNNAAVGPQQSQFGGGFGGNQGGGLGRPYPRPGLNPLQGHPSNGVLVGPGGPTGVIGRPRPFYNNGYGGFGNNNVGPQGFGAGAGGVYPQGQGFPGQGFGGQGLPGQGFGGQGPSSQGFGGQGPASQGFGGGFPGLQGFGGLGGFGGGSGFPNVPGGQAGFSQLQQGHNSGGYGNYGLVTPNQFFGSQYGALFDEPEKENKLEGKSSDRLTSKISNKI